MKETDNCSICNIEIEDGVGRFNTHNGVQCVDCYDKKKKEIKPRYVKIAGYNIPTKLLEDYRDKVDFTRRSVTLAIGRDDPRIVMKALSDRVAIHKAIFKITGHDHDSTAKEPMRIRDALEKWLNENTIEKPQVNGLV